MSELLKRTRSQKYQDKMQHYRKDCRMMALQTAATMSDRSTTTATMLLNAESIYEWLTRNTEPQPKLNPEIKPSQDAD